MRTKLKRVMPLYLVGIFFIIAVLAQHLPISNAVPEEAPEVSFFIEAGQLKLTGMTSEMEYNTISPTYLGEWKNGADSIVVLDNECNMFIRYKEAPSLVQILPIRYNYAIEYSWNAVSNKSITIKLSKDTYIDWGDGTVEKIEKSDSNKEVSHTYSADGVYTVKIADNVVSYFNCNNSNVNTLNVSYNTKLKELHCSGNNIGELDLSKNVLLESLYCNNNSLSGLDLNNNASLEKVSCVQEELSAVTVRTSQFTNIQSVVDGVDNIEANKTLYKRADTTLNNLTITVPSAPSVSSIKNLDGTYRLEGIDNTMEYNTVDLAYVGNWTPYVTGDLQSIEFNEIYYVRIAKVDNVSIASLATTVEVKVIGLEVAIDEEGSEYAKVTGLTTEMEYNNVDANYEGEWTECTEDSLQKITENATYYVRLKEETNNVVKLNVVMIARGDAPVVTGVDNGNGSGRIDGMTTDMEYNTSGYGYTGEWTAWTEGDLQNITESATYYIRYAAVGDTPSSNILKLVILIEEASSKPSITIEENEDGTAKLVGITTSMEYKVGEEDWKTYAEGELEEISENTTYKVRYIGETEEAEVNVVFYTITVGETENGTVTPSGTIKVLEGGSKEFTIAPAEGYEVEDVLVNEVSVGAVTTYTVSEIAEDTAINVTFVESTVAEETYAVKWVWNPTEELTDGVSQLIKGVRIKATSPTQINWGDNTTTDVTVGTNLYTHTYSTAGSYTVTVKDDVVNELDLGRKVSSNSLATTGAIYNNNLSELDVSNNTALTSLYCNNNSLSELDVSNNTALTSLVCNGNNLSELDVSNNTALTSLACYDDSLSELDVSNNTALTILYCYSNNLSELDVSNNTALTRLACYDNSLSELDVNNNTALTILYCYSNNLSELDVSNNTALTDLYCGGNSLSELDLTGNTNISKVCCVQESMTSLFLTSEQKTAVTIIDEDRPCSSSISTDNTIHKHVNAVIITPLSIAIEENEDGTAKLVGMTTSMEYKVGEEEWKTYVEGELQAIEESEVYKIRYIGATEEAEVNVVFYKISVDNTRIVSVSPNGTIKVLKGGSREITITSAKGYEIKDVIIDGESVGKVESYEFTNVDRNHKVEIKATIKDVDNRNYGSGNAYGQSNASQPIIFISSKSSQWKNKFTDVNKNDWYYEVVKFVNERKYFSGTSESTFAPNATMTREMFMAALYNIDGTPITYGANNYFDVTPGGWSEASIVWGNVHNLVSGFPGGNFKPADPVTREQVATILKKYAEYKGQYRVSQGNLEGFNDYQEVSDWANESIRWAVGNGIMKGDTMNRILPQKSATRAEVAAMIMNYKKVF